MFFRHNHTHTRGRLRIRYVICVHASPVIPGPDFLSEKYPGTVVGQVWSESVPACCSLAGTYLWGSYKQGGKLWF